MTALDICYIQQRKKIYTVYTQYCKMFYFIRIVHCCHFPKKLKRVKFIFKTIILVLETIKYIFFNFFLTRASCLNQTQVMWLKHLRLVKLILYF